MSADEEEGGDGADVGVSSKGANFGRPKEGPSAFPWASRIFIVVLGLSLVVCEFAFIFLATTSTSVYPTDPTQLTTMNLRDDASRVGLDISDVLQRGCKVVPITVKPHFIAQARHSLCTRVTSRAAASTSDGADGVAVVRVGLFRGQELVINVSTTGGSREARFRQTVKSGASSMYDILPAITMRDIRTAVPAVLRRYGLGVPDAAGQPFSIPGPLRSATVGLAFRADLTGRVPPPPFSSTGVAAHAAWELYLTNVTASLLRFEARGPARARWDDTELFTIRGIVLRRAPRLGALGVVVVFAVLLVVWAGVAGGLRWGAGVAHHLAWVGRFDGMRGVDDLGGREQRFDVETRRVVA